MRLMMGILSAQNISSVLLGDESLNKRPMDRISKPLIKMSADIKTSNNMPPVFIKPVKKIINVDHYEEIASAQIKSSILLAGLYGDDELSITTPPSRDHTEIMLREFKCNISNDSHIIKMIPSRLQSPGIIQVPGDLFTNISDSSTWTVNDRADYFFYCANETVHGLEIHEPIESESPLICDMSSTIASRPIDIKKYDLIFAGAQKNLGIAGVTILIIKRNLLSRVNKGLLPILDYSKHADDASMLNTSPVFAWYVSGLIFDWIKDQGGVETMAELNQEKSRLLYNFIDQSSFYSNPVYSQSFFS